MGCFQGFTRLNTPALLIHRILFDVNFYILLVAETHKALPVHCTNEGVHVDNLTPL